MYKIPCFGDITDISQITLEYLELELARNCNMACKYCYLKGDTNNSNIFTYHKELLEFLKTIKLNDTLNVGFSTGELFLDDEYSLLLKTIKKLERIKRFKDVKLRYRIYSNCTRPENILDFLNIVDTNNLTIHVSYDGENTTRLNKPYEKFTTLDGLKWLSNYNIARENIVIRYAIYDDISDLFETICGLYDIGFRRFEYYLLEDYYKYSDNEYIALFKDQLVKLLEFTKDHKDMELYNINIYYTNDNPKTWCKPIHTLTVSRDGYITPSPCVNFSKSTNITKYRESCLVKLENFRDLPKAFNSFYNNFLLSSEDRHDIGCNTCDNHMCDDCCSYSRMTDDIEGRKGQQCEFRHAELAVYKQVFGERDV